MRTIVVSGTHSGVGKSSIALGLMAAYTVRGLRVQPFKIGPDFVDSLHHKAATGRESFNLDSWMMSRDMNLACFMRCAADTDVAIVEGAMGLYDGRDGKSEDGSTAEMAKFLNAPVVLVLDCWALARSAAALIRGFTAFDSDVSFAGIIFNKIEGPSHKAWLTDAVTSTEENVQILGAVPNTPGLNMVNVIHEDSGAAASYMKKLSELVEHYVDLDGLLEAADVWKPRGATNLQWKNLHSYLSQSSTYSKQVRIGVARDAAFSVYYQENLALLQDAGAELVFFSPLKDSLPTRLDAIYFGGGHPELHLEKLSANKQMLYAVRAFADAGGIIYGEAGGLMYLSQGIEGEEDQSFPMCAIFPFWTRALQSGNVGYVKATPQESCVLFPPEIGEIRGHMHRSGELFWLDNDGINICPRGLVLKKESRESVEELEGYMQGNVIGTFAHLHFGSNPAVVRTLLERCRMDSSKAAAVAAASASAVANSGPIAAAAAGSAAARAVTAALGESRELVPYDGDAVLRLQQWNQRKSSSMKQEALASEENENSTPRQRIRSLSSSPIRKASLFEETKTISHEIDVLGDVQSLQHEFRARLQSEFSTANSMSSKDDFSVRDAASDSGSVTKTTTATTTTSSTSYSGQDLVEEETLLSIGGPKRTMSSSCLMEHSPALLFPGLKYATFKNSSPQKIVSLVPQATEVIMKLGGGNRLVGVTDVCDKPSGVRMGRHIVCRSLHKSSTTQTVDASFKLDVPWLAKLKPDLIITQEVCKVCSVDSKTVIDAISQAGLRNGHNTKLFVIDAHTVAEVWQFIIEIGNVMGLEKEAIMLVNSLRSRLRKLSVAVAVEQRPKVMILQQIEPLVLGGRWIPEIEMAAAAYDPLQKPGCNSEILQWQRVTAYAPQLIILSICSLSIEETLLQVEKLARQPGFWSLPAVESRKFYLCENWYLNQCGYRLVDGAELLAYIIHPTVVATPPLLSAAVLKLSMSNGQTCRAEELHKHFIHLV